MVRWLLLLFALVTVASHAQSGSPSAQQLADQLRAQQLQNEVELSRMQSDIQRLRLERARRQVDAERDQQTQWLHEQSAQREADAVAAAKKAEEAADEIREEVQLAAVRSADTAYSLIALGLPLAFGIFISRKATKENGMKYEQKFGVAMMVCALLFTFLSLSISDGWAPRFDVLQNLMGWLRIRFFPESEGAYAEHLVDIPTKYVLTALAAVFAYGFMAYLGIVPAWRRSSKATAPDEAIR